MIESYLKTKTYRQLMADLKKYRNILQRISITSSNEFKKYMEIVKSIDKELKYRDYDIQRFRRV